MNKEDSIKLKSKISKFGRISAEHAFLSFLVLTFLALLIGGCLFYQYSILVQRAEPQITQGTIQFKEDFYQEILSQWQEREEKFEAADTKTYSDLFR